MYRTDLRIGEVIYEFVFYNMHSFWLISLNGFDFNQKHKTNSINSNMIYIKLRRLVTSENKIKIVR